MCNRYLGVNVWRKNRLSKKIIKNTSKIDG